MNKAVFKNAEQKPVTKLAIDIFVIFRIPRNMYPSRSPSRSRGIKRWIKASTDTNTLQVTGKSEYSSGNCASDWPEGDRCNCDGDDIEGDCQGTNVQITEWGVGHKQKNCSHKAKNDELRCVEFCVCFHRFSSLLLFPQKECWYTQSGKSKSQRRKYKRFPSVWYSSEQWTFAGRV